MFIYSSEAQAKTHARRLVWANPKSQLDQGWAGTTRTLDFGMRILLAMDQAWKDQLGFSRCLELAEQLLWQTWGLQQLASLLWMNRCLELAEQLLWQAELGLQQLASSLWLSRCLELAEQPFRAAARLWHAHAPESLAEWGLQQEAPLLSMTKKGSPRCPQSKSSCWQADLI